MQLELLENLDIKIGEFTLHPPSCKSYIEFYKGYKAFIYQYAGTSEPLSVADILAAEPEAWDKLVGLLSGLGVPTSVTEALTYPNLSELIFSTREGAQGLIFQQNFTIPRP